MDKRVSGFYCKNGTLANPGNLETTPSTALSGVKRVSSNEHTTGIER